MSAIKLIHKTVTMSDLGGEPIPGTDRESYFFHVLGRGAVEAWRTRASDLHYGDYYGGVEIHFKNPPEDVGCYVERDNCWITGGDCWSDGSSLAFDNARHYFGDPAAMANYLEGWARAELLLGDDENTLDGDGAA